MIIPFKEKILSTNIFCPLSFPGHPDCLLLCSVLQAASSALGGPTLTHAVTRATKMLTATAMPTVATSVQSPYR